MIDAAECMEMSRQAKAESYDANAARVEMRKAGKRAKADRYERARDALADAAEAFERAAEELRQVGLEP